MANIFLDTNILIDLFSRRTDVIKQLALHKLWTSPLSFHILAYINKINIPNEKFYEIQDQFGLVSLTSEILTKSSRGPTPDLEDNIQLHSAVNAHCNFFITNDKLLLKLGYFGETAIVGKI